MGSAGTVMFGSAMDAARSPLAKQLFRLQGVIGVFFGPDFITVTKGDDIDWPVLKPLVFAEVMDFFASGEPLVTDAPTDTAIDDDDDDDVAMIKEVLETRIRPVLQDDGGDIVFRAFEDGIVYLELQGACVGCPESLNTVRYGVENMLMHFVPSVDGVEEYKDDYFREMEAQMSSTAPGTTS